MIPIQCYFKDDELGQKIKDLAKENSRTLSNQILYICKRYVESLESKTPHTKQQ